MSRLGKRPVPVPPNVKVAISGRDVTVESGPKKLTFALRAGISARYDPATKCVIVERQGDDRTSKAMHGTARATIANMVQGVSKGFVKELEVVGVGWTVALQGRTVVLKVGYADERKVPVPAGVDVQVQQTRIKIAGADRQAVGQLAAVIRSQRPPEPYNGKGIKYVDEKIVRKQGKAFAAGVTA